MSKIKIEKYLKISLNVILYAVLITPFIIWSKTLFPFITGKTIYFRILIEMAVVLYTALALLSQQYRPKMNKLSWLVVVFGIIIFITGLTGVDFYKTFWGTIERGEGFLTLSHLIIFFLILIWTLKSKKEWFNYLTGLVAVGILVNLYAVLQRLDATHFFGMRIIHSGEGRLSATIGNAAFMGAFSLAQFWLSSLLFNFKKNIVWKIIFAFSALLSLFVLFQTQTRGAFLGLIFALIVVSLFYIFKHPNQRKRKFGGLILIIILLLISFIFINKNSVWIKKVPMLHRIVTISKTDITTETRLLAWDTSWKGWKDRFFLGYGWENYNIAYNKYFHAEVYKDSGSQLWFDRAHNTIFDIAVATGVFGLINYLAIFAFAFYFLYKKLKDDFEASLILIGLLVAHFVQNIFVFDVLSTFIILFIVLAYIVFQSFQNTRSREKTEFSNINWIILTTVVCLSIFSIYYFNLKPLKANFKSVDALIAANTQQENTAVKYFEQAINMHTYQTPELRYKLADNIIVYNHRSNKLNDADIGKNYEIAIKNLKDNLSEHPLDVQTYLYLMAVLNKATSYNPAYHDEVIKIGQQAIPLSPTRPQIYFEMGQAEVTRGNYEKGIAYFQHGIDLYPKNLESHWNLMAAYNLAHQFDKADAKLQYMIDKGYNILTPKNLNRLYNVYLLAKRYDKMVETLQMLIKIEPSGMNYARLAAVYKQMGNFVKAREAVLKAVEKDPRLTQEAQKFIQTLK